MQNIEVTVKKTFKGAVEDRQDHWTVILNGYTYVVIKDTAKTPADALKHVASNWA